MTGRIAECPRCHTGTFTPYGVHRYPDDPLPPALSRVADIYVCSACGNDEALRDLAGVPPVPPDEWPTLRLDEVTG